MAREAMRLKTGKQSAAASGKHDDADTGEFGALASGKLVAADSRKPASSVDDTARLSLNKTDRKKLGMDAWEPSLLRKLLTAQDRLKTRK